MEAGGRGLEVLRMHWKALRARENKGCLAVAFAPSSASRTHTIWKLCFIINCYQVISFGQIMET